MTLPLLRSRVLDATPGVVHGFTTRRRAPGGPGELDLGSDARPDDWLAVAEAVGLPGAGVARLRQVHGAAVVEATGAGFAGEADAAVTGLRGLLLAVRVADCVPILVAGQDRVAAVHAGWRGLAAGVIPAALERLGAARAAVVGPCICVQCYEVGEEVIAGIAARVPEPDFARRDLGARPHADLRAAAAFQLRSAGVDVVDVLGACTRCDPDLFSYRRDGAAAGRLAGVIGLAP